MITSRANWAASGSRLIRLPTGQYMYLPKVGVSVAFGVLLHEWTGEWPKYVIAGIVLALLSCLSYRQVPLYLGQFPLGLASPSFETH